jgi:hypothetical protein
MLFFLGWLFTPFYVGWLLFPCGFYFLQKAYRTKKGLDSFYCNICSAAIEDGKASKCPSCGADLK